MERENGLPADWRERIKDKKVIFYNTSIANLLSGGEKHIAKIAHTLETFRAQNEVVLWWRPHPLELSTIESMRPDLAEKYKAIRKKYEEEDWGILDTSADLHRAIAVSDAYYGDWSSVIQLYRKTGKPVLTQSDSVIETLPTMLLPQAALLKEDYVWFIQLNTNKLLKIRKDTLKIEKIITIPYEPVYKQRNYNYHVIDCGNQLGIVFGGSKNLYIYNIQTEEIEVCNVCQNGHRLTSEIVINKDNELFLFPYNSREVMTYSIKEKKVQEKIIFPQKVKLSKQYEQIKDEIYSVDYDSNTIYKIDLNNNKYSSIKVGSNKNKYWGIKKAGDFFVLPHTDKKTITLWNEEKEEVIELSDFPPKYDCIKGNAYLSMYSKDENVYLIPFYANMILKIDTIQKEISQCFDDVLLNSQYCKASETFQGEFFIDSMLVGGCVYAYATYQKKWYIFDLETLEVKRSSSMLVETPEDIEKIEQIVEYQDNDNYNEESLFTGECYSICTLTNYIKNVRKYSNGYKNKRLKGNAGEIIYKYIMEN